MRMVVGIRSSSRDRQASSHAKAPMPTILFASWLLD
mgnify:CR=1 FL=1